MMMGTSITTNIDDASPTESEQTAMLHMLQQVSSFVPTAVRERYASGDGLMELAPYIPPEGEIEHAVLLFADISGFSRLAHNLGNNGAEILVQRINSLFCVMMSEIEQYGGDVIAFAGDCLICLWKTGSSMDCISAAAASCAMLKDLSMTQDNDLNLHCGIGYGPARLIHVGYEDNYEVLATGEAVDKAGKSLDLSSLGEVVVCPQAWEAIQHVAKGYVVPGQTIESVPQDGALIDAESRGMEHQLANTQPHEQPMAENEMRNRRSSEVNLNGDSTAAVRQLPHPLHMCVNTIFSTALARSRHTGHHRGVSSFDGIDNAQLLRCLSAYVPSPALKLLQTGTAVTQNVLAEMRNVTTLFIKLDALGEAGPACELKECDMGHSSFVPLSDVQGTFTRLGKLVDYWGGMTRQFVVDDKGCILIVCFGVPGFSHVNDSERGVMLGFSVKKSLSDGTLSSIGISTGKVFCGIVGNQLRHEYAMVGDAINVAARLACLRQTDFIVDERTYKTTCLSIEHEELDPVHLKGQSSFTNIYRPIRPKEVHRGLSIGSQPHEMAVASLSVLGREREKIAILSSLCKRVPMVLHGDYGIGKTSLMSFAAHLSSTMETESVYISGYASASTKPMGALAHQVSKLMGIFAENLVDLSDQLPTVEESVSCARAHLMSIMESMIWYSNDIFAELRSIAERLSLENVDSVQESPTAADSLAPLSRHLSFKQRGVAGSSCKTGSRHKRFRSEMQDIIREFDGFSLPMEATVDEEGSSLEEQSHTHIGSYDRTASGRLSDSSLGEVTQTHYKSLAALGGEASIPRGMTGIRRKVLRWMLLASPELPLHTLSLEEVLYLLDSNFALGLGQTQPESLAEVDEHVTMLQLADVVYALIKSKASRTFLVDNIQDLDSVSWEVVRRLACAGESFVLMSMETKHFEAREEIFSRDFPHLVVCQVQPLSFQDMRTLILQSAHAEDVSLEVLDMIWEGSHGNPKICVELIQAMLESSVLKVLGSKRAQPSTPSTTTCQNMGADAITDAGSHGKHEQHGQPPDSISVTAKRQSRNSNSSRRGSWGIQHMDAAVCHQEGTRLVLLDKTKFEEALLVFLTNKCTSESQGLSKLFLQGFDELPAMEQQMLKVASIIGDHFTPALIIRLLPPAMQHESPTEHAFLNLLELRYFVYDKQAGPTSDALHSILTGELQQETFSFSKLHKRSLIYELMTVRARRALHEEAAKLLQVLFPSYEPRLAYLVALHYHAAGNVGMELRYRDLASRTFFQEKKYADVAQQLRKALELVFSTDEKKLSHIGDSATIVSLQKRLLLLLAEVKLVEGNVSSATRCFAMAHKDGHASSDTVAAALKTNQKASATYDFKNSPLRRRNVLKYTLRGRTGRSRWKCTKWSRSAASLWFRLLPGKLALSRKLQFARCYAPGILPLDEHVWIVMRLMMCAVYNLDALQLEHWSRELAQVMTRVPSSGTDGKAFSFLCILLPKSLKLLPTRAGPRLFRSNCTTARASGVKMLELITQQIVHPLISGLLNLAMAWLYFGNAKLVRARTCAAAALHLFQIVDKVQLQADALCILSAVHFELGNVESLKYATLHLSRIADCTKSGMVRVWAVSWSLQCCALEGSLKGVPVCQPVIEKHITQLDEVPPKSLPMAALLELYATYALAFQLMDGFNQGNEHSVNSMIQYAQLALTIIIEKGIAMITAKRPLQTVADVLLEAAREIPHEGPLLRSDFLDREERTEKGSRDKSSSRSQDQNSTSKGERTVQLRTLPTSPVSSQSSRSGGQMTRLSLSPAQLFLSACASFDSFAASAKIAKPISVYLGGCAARLINPEVEIKGEMGKAWKLACTMGLVSDAHMMSMDVHIPSRSFEGSSSTGSVFRGLTRSSSHSYSGRRLLPGISSFSDVLEGGKNIMSRHSWRSLRRSPAKILSGPIDGEDHLHLDDSYSSAASAASESLGSSSSRSGTSAGLELDIDGLEDEEERHMRVLMVDRRRDEL